MSATIQMIPFFCATELPPDVEEYCIEHGHPVHYDSGVVEVELREPNPLAAWLESLGYEFSPREKKRGWGHIALMGS